MDESVERAIRLSLENWEQLGVEEHDGALHLPHTIRRRTVKGSMVEVPVSLRPPANRHRFKARGESRALALKLDLDLDRDKDMVEELENYALLTYCVRDRNGDQHVPDTETLLAKYDNTSLGETWAALDAWVQTLDPRFGEMTEEDLWRVIVGIANGVTIRPFTAMPGHEQATCIALMAKAACSSPTAPSWARSSETSMPA